MTQPETSPGVWPKKHSITGTFSVVGENDEYVVVRADEAYVDFAGATVTDPAVLDEIATRLHVIASRWRMQSRRERNARIRSYVGEEDEL